MSSGFRHFQLKPYLLKALAGKHIQTPTDIQEKIIPLVLEKKSVVGQSQTGTGKTFAFLLPILTLLDPGQKKVQAVITAPTRELATQLYQEAQYLLDHAEPEEKISVKVFYGGTDKSRDIERLKTPPQLVIGTPGRINDLAESGALPVHTASIMVVDEADMTLEMGFLVDVDRIAARLPKRLQMLVFSATIPENLKPFLKKYMENPVFIEVGAREIVPPNIEHIFVPLRGRKRIDLVVEIARSFNPFLALIFANTRKMVDEIAMEFSKRGIKTGVIHGDLTQRERKNMMNRIRQLEFQYVVATDLAARGIDIEGVSHVIQYELPRDLHFYIHRAGRTGRGDYTGICATIITEEDEKRLEKLAKIGIDYRFKDLENGEWKSIQLRRVRKRKTEEIILKKPKKIKPGYKKKQLAKLKQLMKRQKRRGKV
mgnify:FL=1